MERLIKAVGFLSTGELNADRRQATVSSMNSLEFSCNYEAVGSETTSNSDIPVGFGIF